MVSLVVLAETGVGIDVEADVETGVGTGVALVGDSCYS